MPCPAPNASDRSATGLLRRLLGADAQARVAAVLARSPVLDLGVIAETAGLPLRRTRRVLQHLELEGAVLLHATPRRTTVHVLRS
jgi:hypothetical protein